MSEIAVIPDLHADPDRLEASLGAATQARLAFLGDFIDAGKATARADDRTVLKRVRHLVEDRDALAVMGNHELNAVLYHTTGSHGHPLRPHLPQNRDQHASFLSAFGTGTKEARAWCDWFLTLPLWQERDGLRLVHACWDVAAIATIAARRPDARLRPEDLAEVAAKETPFARAVERLTSGPEVRLPRNGAFHDGKGVRRVHVRLAWWRAQGGTWRDAALSVPDPGELPDEPVRGAEGLPVYPPDAPPVLVGHYKMTGAPRIEAARAACLDYPNAPCLYLWRGGTALSDHDLLTV